MKSLVLKEEVGDSPTHLMKSGAALRTEAVECLGDFSDKIPEHWRGVHLSYDLWWDTGVDLDPKTNRPFINGYCYTDMLARCLYFRPPSSALSRQLLETVVCNNGENIDEVVVQRIIKDLDDKYRLSTAKDVDWPERVVFLPGTNILEQVVDIKKVQDLVNDEGAKVKPHPLTSRYHKLMLNHQYGKDNIISNEVSGMDYLRNCEVVFCCVNSEMGIAGLLLGKDVCIVNQELVTVPATYGSVYSVIFGTKGVAADYALRKILSSDYSGIFHIDDPRAEEKMYNFLNSFNLFRKI